MKIVLSLALTLGFVFAACSKSAPPQSASSPASAQPAFDHKLLDEILATHVDANGWVNYTGVKQDRAKLDQYLSTLATAKPETFANDAERLAFWINGYNAFILAGVLDDVLGKVKSVNDIDKMFFKEKKHKIAGAELTLDEIEGRGRDLKDPRIHFAVNCASASCPKLQPFAYTGAKLDFQLTKGAREFLGDSGRGMSYDPGRNIVYLSPIFKWYAGDFTGENAAVARVKAEASGAELLEIAKKYMPPDVAQFLGQKQMTVQWLKYDWSLNSQEERKGEGEKGRRGEGETGRRGEREKGRRGDGEKGRKGDGEKGRRGEGEKTTP